MKYKWNSRKLSRKQHLCSDDGLTYCKAENGSWQLDTLSDIPDSNRKTCSICLHIQKRAGQKKSKRGDKKRAYDAFLRSWEWKQVRYAALKASNGACSACGRRPHEGVVLQVDHIKPRRHYPELALTLSNLQVLCSDCNHGKGNWDETDWRGSHQLKVVMGEAI